MDVKLKLVLHAAMASGAVVELMGGTPKMSLDALLSSLKCIRISLDPVAGLVEIPCAKRNVLVQ